MLTVVISLLLVGRSRVESQSGQGFVELGFMAKLISPDGTTPIADLYQRLQLNIVSVRLNPSPDLTISDDDPNWVTIPAPAAIGSSNPTEFITTSLNFGGSGTELTAATSELQADLMPLQNLPFFFNAAGLNEQIFQQLELVLDSITPGNAVPLCHAGASESCISYSALLSPQASLRAAFPNGGYQVLPATVQPLVVNITMNVGPPPTSDPNTSTVAISPVISAQGNLVGPFTPMLGIVMGTVANFDPATTTVSAEYSGTNQIVATTHLLGDGSCPPGVGPPCFILDLPALSKREGGTLYDFYVSGNTGYAVRSHVAVVRGTNPSLDLSAGPSSGIGTVTGTVADVCNGRAIEAATLKLLVPDTSRNSGITACDLTGSPPHIPASCVVVATAATDDQGGYPLPSTPFTAVPLTPPAGVSHYDLEISAAGYNTTVAPIAPGSVSCPTSRFSNSCSFGLEHGYMAGTVSTPNFTGNRLDVLVMAEDSGTSNIENLSLATVPGGSTSATFTMPIPDALPSSNTIPVNNFDVFASVQDLFQGVPEKISGHQIGIAASVGAPAAGCSTLTIPALSPMFCDGLGSVFGDVTKANPGTTSVRLSKTVDGVHEVQIMETEPDSIGPGPPPANTTPGNVYNFCAPSDSYTLTHYEGPTARAAVPVSSATINLTPPFLGSTCPSICQSSASSCLICQQTQGPTLP
jgi:hypothetical protein